jgi:Tfp pilus assembly protein PilW
MKIHGSTFRKFRASKRRGMTLIEMTIALGIGFVLIAGITVISIGALRSFVGMGNYVDMDWKSRETLDQLSRDIRRSTDIVSYTTNQIVLSVLDYNGAITQVTYNYQTNVLTRTYGANAPDTLMTGCNGFTFQWYQKTPQTNGGYQLATNVASAKSIGITWKCTRTCLWGTTNTEAMQEAIIVMRNKP